MLDALAWVPSLHSLQSVSGGFLCSEGRRAFFLRTATQSWQVSRTYLKILEI